MDKSKNKSWFELLVDEENGILESEEEEEDIKDKVPFVPNVNIKKETEDKKSEKNGKDLKNELIKNVKKEKEDVFPNNRHISTVRIKQEKEDAKTIETKCLTSVKQEKEETKVTESRFPIRIKQEVTETKPEIHIKREDHGEISDNMSCAIKSESYNEQNGEDVKFKTERNRKRDRDSSDDKYPKRPFQSSEKGAGSSPTKKTKSQKLEYETDPATLARRQKQIDYGKNTICYDRYRQLVPKPARKKEHPRTPPKHLKYSRRAWDGMVRVWRQRLHFWDEPSEGGGGDVSDTLSDISVELRSHTSDGSGDYERHAAVKRDKCSSFGSIDESLDDFLQLDSDCDL